ncbi:MAG: M48 family metallopeptidase [Kiritimatiellia bacterium]
MGEYPGQVLHDQYPRGRKGGTFHSSPEGLVFDTGERRIPIPLDDLHITVGGSGNRLTYLASPRLPGYSFYSPDKALLRDPLFHQSADLAARAAAARTSHQRGRMIFAGVLAGLIGILALLSFFYDPLIHRAALAVPVRWEKALGDRLAPLVTADSRKLEDPRLDEQLDLITRPLVAAAATRGETFTFTVVENTGVNAFALPGGQVVIFSGLLMKARSAEEVAGVLAHEIAHVTRRHQMRGLLKNAGLFVAVQAMLGDATGVGAVVAQYASSLSSLSYSRGFEREADRRAWETLNAAGIDPRGMIAFFEGLLQDQGEVTRKMEEKLSVLSTHPATEERIRTLKRLPVRPEYTPIALDYPAFKQHLGKLLEASPAPAEAPAPPTPSPSNQGESNGS